MEGKPLREIQKSKTVTVTVMEGWKVKYLSKVVWDRKIIKMFLRSISSTRIGQPVFMMDVSKDKHISRSMLDKIEQKTVHNDEEGDR